MPLSAGAFDPECIGLLRANIIWNGQKMVFLDITSDQFLRLVNARIVFLLGFRQLEFRKIPVFHLLDLQKGSSAAQFGITERVKVLSRIRHEANVFEKPVVVVDSYGTGMIQGTAVGGQPIVVVADRMQSGF